MSENDLKRNVKIYPWYRAFSYDFLFLWTISILYLTQIKHFSYSQVILLDSIFMLSAFLLQIPISKLIQKIGRASAIRIAGICSIGFVVIYLLGQDYWLFIFANALYGIMASIKNVADVEILSLTLKKLKRRNNFSEYEGKGQFGYYIIEAITAIASGYLYEYVSPYAPLIGTLCCSLILLILSFIIRDPLDEEDDVILEEMSPKTNREPAFKTLLKRPFVVWMVIFCFCFFGISSVHQTLSKVYLQNINFPAYLFGYIFCGYRLIAALASKFQFKYELKKGVRCLLIFSLMMILAYISASLIYSINASAIISIIIVLFVFSTQHISRAIYRITVKNYINSCVSKNSLTKTLTLYSMAECLGYAFATMFTSAVLEVSGNSYVVANLSLVAVFALPLLISSIFFVRALIKSYMTRCTIIRKDIE